MIGTPEPRSTTIAGLAGRVWGRGHDRPWLLLHGAAGSSRHWTWFARALPLDITCVAVDLPGHGASPGRLPVAIRSVVERLDAVVESLGPPVPVVAHSWGGLLALGLALARPDAVSRLGLIATAARLRVHPELVTQLATGMVDASFVSECFGPGSHRDRLELVMSDIARTRCSSSGEVDPFDVAGTDFTVALPTIEIPTAVLLAERDPVVSPRRTRAMAELLPCSRSWQLTGGHYLHLERPLEVAQAVLAVVGTELPGMHRRSPATLFANGEHG